MDPDWKVCSVCKRLMAKGHKNKKGIILFNIRSDQPVNVWACENCWHEEPFEPSKENKTEDE